MDKVRQIFVRISHLFFSQFSAFLFYFMNLKAGWKNVDYGSKSEGINKEQDSGKQNVLPQER